MGTKSVSDITGLVTDEIYERQQRANNLIFFNAEESKSDIVEERREHDMENIANICSAIEADVIGKVKKVMRIGKAKENYCRSLKVSMIDMGAKKMIKSKAKTCKVIPL